jgi:predicted phage baseplate assembly protein
MPVSRVGQVRRQIEVGGRKRFVKAAFDPLQSATSALAWPAGDALPQVWITSTEEGVPFDWQTQSDLLRSGADDRHFVVENDTDGRSRLRFGDGALGLRPDSGTTFVARYRVGNGTAGNVGAEAICYAVTNDARIASVRNPLPARAGRDAETPAQIRRRAPEAFATQERAVTAEDYAEFAGRVPTVQRAAATPRWTGSWHTMFVNTDREGAAPVDAGFQDSVRDFLERYRMAGHDLEIDAPVYVSLKLTLEVCVKPEYFRSDVVKALYQTFSNGLLPDGRKGYFHPDNFTFAGSVYLSPILAAAHAVPGVLAVTGSVFQKDNELPTQKYIQSGVITLGRLEVARLDNDPDFAEHGVLVINAGGGK